MYVTKPQLDESLAHLEQRIDAKFAAQDQRIDAKFAEQTQLMLDNFRLVFVELARHSRANQEDLSAQIKVVDEKYADLPARVAALEAKSTP